MKRFINWIENLLPKSVTICISSENNFGLRYYVSTDCITFDNNLFIIEDDNIEMQLHIENGEFEEYDGEFYIKTKELEIFITEVI